MKGSTQPPVKYRHDYRPSAFLIDRVELRFELAEHATEVEARLWLRRNPSVAPTDILVLDGEQLELLSVSLDDQPLTDERYRIDDEHLSIFGVPADFQLSTRVRIDPKNNTALSGLYMSSGKYCTQCEAEGFRRITYYLDRPDVMAVFTTTVIAEKQAFPFLLANGNPIARGELDDGRHFVTWEDPFRKPAYLFALVAGDFDHLRDYFTTASGRAVTLDIFVDKGQGDKCQHAMESLKKAMRWDEERFGLEYDLDIYMIVAVSDFNMGAMENKGLNIFNTKYVLARAETATDSDFDGIESVIAHEYFHNWTGNRVTCRDWFQLSLKEGLTVYRDQEFSSDVQSRAVKRIDDVKVIRSVQFSEDAGPMAHPIRPDSYIEMNNFYTVTVYNKGAEIIRMYETLLGREGFRRGMDRYFQRHDGQAVTCDDFVAAMADANGQDLSRFSRWYSQSGTPELEVRDDYDESTRRYFLHLRQSCPPTPGQDHKEPFHIPVKLGLLGRDGRALCFGDGQGRQVFETVLSLVETEQSFVFEDIPERPVPSLLRDFSAPVKLHYAYSDADLALLFAHDDNPFNRWDAGQRLSLNLLLNALAKGELSPVLPESFIAAFRNILLDTRLDPAFKARALILPDENYLVEFLTDVDAEAVFRLRQSVRTGIAKALRPLWENTYQENRVDGDYRFEGAAVGRRALRNLALSYLMLADADRAAEMAYRQYREANNMTERFAAFRELVHQENRYRDSVLADFFTRFEGDALVLDKWFSVQATSPLPDTLARVRALLNHSAFSLRNPNKVRALIGAFAMSNPRHFHAADGSGYRFVAEQLVVLNGINPQIAARLAGAFNRWRKYHPENRQLMRGVLENLVATPELSRDVYEIASKALA